MSEVSNSPTGTGHTQPAGSGVSDDEMSREVAGQTDPNQDAEDVFGRESEGASSEAPATETGADDLQ